MLVYQRVCWLSRSYQWIDDHPPIWLSSPSYDHLMTILWPWHTWPNTTGDSYRDQPRKKHCSLDWEPCQWDTQHDKNSYMLIPERQMIHITHQSGNSQVYIWEIQVSHIETFWESLLHCSDRFWKDFLFSLVHWPPSSGDMEPCFPCHHGRTHWS